jgi:hypothetical protein
MGGRKLRTTKLTDHIRHHLAISAVGPSAGRRMMRKGDIKGVRKFLDKLDIKQFSRRTKFRSSLDLATKSLARHLPPSRWGAARKFINLFLRTATYNFYLRKKYKLNRVESLLELPLDSFTAEGLRDEPEGNLLPRWKGVIYLTPNLSADYQIVAARVAAKKKMHRVHLDMLYWRREKVRTRSMKNRISQSK